MHPTIYAALKRIQDRILELGPHLRCTAPADDDEDGIAYLSFSMGRSEKDETSVEVTHEVADAPYPGFAVLVRKGDDLNAKSYRFFDASDSQLDVKIAAFVRDELERRHGGGLSVME